MKKMSWTTAKKHGYTSKINGGKYILAMNEEGATTLMPFELYKKMGRKV